MIKINLKNPASQFSKENLNRFWWSIKKCFELSIKVISCLEREISNYESSANQLTFQLLLTTEMPFE